MTLATIGTLKLLVGVLLLNGTVAMKIRCKGECNQDVELNINGADLTVKDLREHLKSWAHVSHGPHKGSYCLYCQRSLMSRCGSDINVNKALNACIIPKPRPSAATAPTPPPPPPASMPQPDKVGKCKLQDVTEGVTAPNNVRMLYYYNGANTLRCRSTGKFGKNSWNWYETIELKNVKHFEKLMEKVYELTMNDGKTYRFTGALNGGNVTKVAEFIQEKTAGNYFEAEAISSRCNLKVTKHHVSSPTKARKFYYTGDLNILRSRSTGKIGNWNWKDKINVDDIKTQGFKCEDNKKFVLTMKDGTTYTFTGRKLGGNVRKLAYEIKDKLPEDKVLAESFANRVDRRRLLSRLQGSRARKQKLLERIHGSQGNKRRLLERLQGF